MKHKLLSGICIGASCVAINFSVFADDIKAFEQPATYSDKQQHSLVNKESLMADTSSEAYVEEFTDPFTSFYFGFGGVFSKTKATFEERYSYLSPIKTYNTESKTGFNAFTGCGRTFDNVYFGGEIFLNSIDSESTNIKISLSNYSFGGNLRLGYLLTRSFMLYALAGVDLLKYSNNETSESSGYKVGLMPGVGAEFLLNDNWGVRTQYTYTMSPKESYSLESIYNKEFKSNRGNLSLSIVYRFN